MVSLFSCPDSFCLWMKRFLFNETLHLFYLFKNWRNWSNLISSTMSAISTMSVSFGKQPRALMAVPSSWVGIEPSPSWGTFRSQAPHFLSTIYWHLVKQVKYLLGLLDVHKAVLTAPLVEAPECPRSEVQDLLEVHCDWSSGCHVMVGDPLLITSKLLYRLRQTLLLTGGSRQLNNF